MHAGGTRPLDARPGVVRGRLLFFARKDDAGGKREKNKKTEEETPKLAFDFL